MNYGYYFTIFRGKKIQLAIGQKILLMSSSQISRDNYLNYILQKLTFKFNF